MSSGLPVATQQVLRKKDWLGVVVHVFNPSTRTQEAETVDLCEFKASLIYSSSSRTAQGLHSETVSKPNQAKPGSGEIAQRLRTLAALEDLI